MAREAGYNGVLRSLGNYAGKSYVGRDVNVSQVSLTTTVQTLLPNNGTRLYALIQNQSSSADMVIVNFGADPSATAGIKIYAGGSLQIDAFLPWTGDIRAVCPTSTATVNVLEGQVI